MPTLVISDSILKEKEKDGISYLKELQSDGYQFVLIRNSNQTLDDTLQPDYTILGNGSIIQDCYQEILYQEKVDPSFIQLEDCFNEYSYDKLRINDMTYGYVIQDILASYYGELLVRELENKFQNVKGYFHFPSNENISFFQRNIDLFTAFSILYKEKKVDNPTFLLKEPVEEPLLKEFENSCYMIGNKLSKKNKETSLYKVLKKVQK